MNVSNEVYERCVKMIEKELSDATFNLTQNKRKINLLAKEQRTLKKQKSYLYGLLRTLKNEQK